MKILVGESCYYVGNDQDDTINDYFSCLNYMPWNAHSYAHSYSYGRYIFHSSEIKEKVFVGKLLNTIFGVENEIT